MKTTLILLCLALFTLSCHDGESNYDASGTFEADEIIISAEVSGTIEQFDVEEGTQLKENQFLGWIDSTQLHLRKKQLLAQIDAILSRRPQIATQLASYRVQLENAEREMRRLQKLQEADAATQKQVDDATAQVAVIRRQMEAHRSSLDISSQGLVSETLPLSAQVEQIDDQIGRSRIVNPVAGTVLQQYAEAHELVNPGKPLYKIADLSSLELRAYITGSQLPQVKLNQQVSVVIDDGNGGYKPYEGIVSWISDKAEFTPKTIQTKDERANLVYALNVRVKNDGFLKIGMYGEVKF
jgi:HlyD family secretion protein